MFIRALLIVLGMAAVVAVSMAAASCGGGGESAEEALARQISQQGQTPATPPPATPAGGQVAAPPPGAPPAGGAPAAPPPTAGAPTPSPAPVPGGTGGAPPAPGGAAPPAAGAKGGAPPGGAPAGGKTKPPSEGDAIKNFQDMDPLKIIIQKYDDLYSKHTTPSDEESDDFIPETGRVDPLTRVSDAVPDDLKPARTGETDETDIITYLETQMATEAVLEVEFSLQCHSVIQIGLIKFVNVAIGNGPSRSIPEGGGLFAWTSNGYPVIVMCTKISTKEVNFDLIAGPVTKSVVFIPQYSSY